MIGSGLPLQVRNLEIAYTAEGGAPRTVLSIADWQLAAGDQAALCGPSGSGKTSLIHVLAGIDRPASGAVCWGVVDIATLGRPAVTRWRRASVGLVFQQFHLFSGMTAIENVVLGARFEAISVPPALLDRARRLLAHVRIEERRMVETLSRGEMQRVAIARALVRHPAILLADEPTASLDPETAAWTVDLLCELCRSHGATLLVATHDADLAGRLPTRYAITRHGRVLPGTA